MIEKTGTCPLCKEEFGREESLVRCPGCGIGLRKTFPLIRLCRAWYWELTEDSLAELCDLYLNRPPT